MPIYLAGSDIDTASESALQTHIDKAVKEQYGERAITPFHQTHCETKVLLLDDFDRLHVPQKYQRKALDFLKRCFPLMVVSVSDIFTINEIVSADTAETFANQRHYELQEFGYLRRYELIRRWINLGDTYGMSEQECAARIDRAEKILTAVVGRNLVPSVPIYLLTLLQSLETGHQAAVQSSGFVYYYQYLILQALQRIAIRPEQWDDLFNYMAHLAWAFREAGAREFDVVALQDLNERYSKTYATVDLDKRLALLVHARLVNKRGDYYSFSYPYVYYFFLGKYMSDNLNDPKLVELVKHYCEHLYVRDYAHTILFLTHFSKEPFVIGNIETSLKGLFGDQQPIKLEEDAKHVNDLVDSTVKLIIQGGDVHERRAMVFEAQDEIVNQGGMIDGTEEESEGDLDVIAKINALFKTTDILGQILKSYYGSIPRVRKEELLREIIEGPLRALGGFVNYIRENREALIHQVEGWLDKDIAEIPESKRNSVARRAVFSIVGLVAFWFLYRGSVAIASDHLKENLRHVVDTNSSLAFRLIQLGVRLEVPGELPIEEIEGIAQETKQNIFAHRLLQSLVGRHLYMFKTPEREKQRVCKILNIHISEARAIDVLTRKQKRFN